MNWDAILFDFDGVITDTEPLHWDTFRGILRARGMDCTWEEYCSDYMGFDDRGAFEAAFARYHLPLSPETLKQCIAEKAGLFAAVAAKTPIQPYPGVVRFLRELQSHGIPLALCSGALRCDIDPLLEKFEISTVFSVISTAECVSRSKPSPEPYQWTVQRLCEVTGRPIQADRCVAFEDTREGMQSARGAGLNVIAVVHQGPVAEYSDVLSAIQGFEGMNEQAMRRIYSMERKK